MSGNDKLFVEPLGKIVRLLADAWPSEREDIAVAGAEFEEVAGELSRAVGLRDLIDQTWKGLMYLYQEDDYFMSVKSATMQAVNMIREYQLRDGDVQIEEVEGVCKALEKALAGESESADTLMDLDEIEAVKNRSREEKGGESYTLDDLAAYIMELDEDSVSEDELETLGRMIYTVMNQSTGSLSKTLKEALVLVQKTIALDAESRNGWMRQISEMTEKAIQIESDQEWEVSSENAPATAEEGNPGKADTSPQTTSSSAESSKGASEDSSQEQAPQEQAAGSSASSSPPDSKEFTLPEDIEMDMVDEFISECNDLIGTAESALLDLEGSPDDDELVNTVFRAFHTIKGTSAFMGLDSVSEFTHSAETMLSMVRDGELPFDSACADISFQSIDILKELLSVIESADGGDPLPLPREYGSLMGVLHKVSEEGEKPADALSTASGAAFEPAGSSSKQAESSKPAGSSNKPAESSNPAASDDAEGDKTSGPAEQPKRAGSKGGGKKASSGKAAKQSAQKSASKSATKPTNESAKKRSGSSRKSDSESSVRVNVSRLDRLVDMVGELVIAHSVVAQDSVMSKDTELQKKVNHASKILRELQDTSLTLRMVPLKSTFQKMNRLVRDLSRKAGKPVTFSTIGEDTEIDRNMVDVINEPLVHMLRNALDHGIEDPEARKETDKPDVATIWFRAFQEGGKVVIEIEDDGRGIDKEKILAKAISKGLVEPDARLSEKEIFNLIFAPGFSSVEKVTDLSGRGVGMDVVKRSIEQLQGKIDVSSELGKGTKMSLELPFTLAITDGMLIRVGDQRFIIPIISIDTAFRATEEDLFTVMDDSEQVMYQGKTIPVIRLHRLFNLTGATENLLEGTMLVVRSSNSRYALFVDDVIGQKQLVGKSIDIKVQMNHISGGAILEDGQVGLILDTAAIVN